MCRRAGWEMRIKRDVTMLDNAEADRKMQKMIGSSA